MNFRTHKQQIIDSIEIALTKRNRVDIIERFKIILSKCKSLLKSDRFDFWLYQLGSIPDREIPLTKFGLEEASRLLPSLITLDRNKFGNSILDICENLFTYYNAEELCPFQTEYHYYFYLPKQKIFKESKMGHTNLEEQNVNSSEIRIAKISEIEVDRSEYI